MVHVDSMLIYCWADVLDVGPASRQHCINIKHQHESVVLRGFIKLKKFKNPRRTREVEAPTRIIVFFLEMLCFLCFFCFLLL